MKLYRIKALVWRYMLASRDLSRVFELIFWPMIDIGFFGLIAFWGGMVANEPSFVKLFVTGLVLWQVIYRANYEICVNVLDEIVEQSLIHLIASPLKKGEWIISMMLSGLLKIGFTLLFGAGIAYLFFRVNVFAIGWPFVVFVFYCLFSGWIIGFLAGGVSLVKGKKLQSLPWVAIMLAGIFSAVFYPVQVLPPPMQMIAKILPMSYIFEGMRALLTEGILPSHYLLTSAALTLIYLTVAIKFFLFMFERSRQYGLSKQL